MGIAENTKARRRSQRRRGGRRHDYRAVDGLLLLDKPVGMTSNAALQRVRRLFRARKAGHTGSLDPLASGMLPICFGHATKLSAYLLDADKTYRVTAQFGSRTDTADAEGRVVAESPGGEVERAMLEQAITNLRGDIEQVPPMYSALKQDGRRLYELAREGKEVERAARPVTIHELEVESWDPSRPVLRVRCSKGTYVRTLVEDIAEAAGTLGHVAALRRLSVGDFPADEMVSMGDLEDVAARDEAELERFLRPIDEAISGWPAVHLNADQAYYLRRGNPVHTQEVTEPCLVRVYETGHRFIGVGEVLRDGRLAPRRLFLDAPGEANEAGV